MRRPERGDILPPMTDRIQVQHDPPGQVQRFALRELATADSRFGPAIDERDHMLAAGGLERLAWYLLDPE